MNELAAAVGTVPSPHKEPQVSQGEGGWARVTYRRYLHLMCCDPGEAAFAFKSRGGFCFFLGSSGQIGGEVVSLNQRFPAMSCTPGVKAASFSHSPHLCYLFSSWYYPCGGILGLGRCRRPLLSILLALLPPL